MSSDVPWESQRWQILKHKQIHKHLISKQLNDNNNKINNAISDKGLTEANDLQVKFIMNSQTVNFLTFSLNK